MTEHPAGPGRHSRSGSSQSRLGKARAAALGFGLGATVALSPLVWAQTQTNPANTQGPDATPPLSQGAPVLPQQSFAPLVKRVLPAVVNISVTEQSGTEMMGYDAPDRGSRRFRGMPEQFRGSPFEDFMRRFFDRNGDDDSATPGPFSEGPNSEGPGDGSGVKRIALGSGFIIDPSGIHRDQQPRRRQILEGRGRIAGQQPLSGARARPRPAHRHRGAEDQRGQEAALCRVWRQQRVAGRRLGHRGRQPVRARRQRHTGIISARGRDIHSGPVRRLPADRRADQPRQSGGPTFNSNGEVIGINTAIYSPNGGSVGIGFAVPSNVAKVVEQIEAHGKVSRGWLGVQIQQVTPAIAASLVPRAGTRAARWSPMSRRTARRRRPG